MDDAEELRARIEAKVAARRSEVPPVRRERTRRRSRDDESAPEDQDSSLPFEDLPVPRSLEPARPWLPAEGDLGPDTDDPGDEPDRDPGDAAEESGAESADESVGAEPAAGARTLQPIRPWLFQSPSRAARAPEPPTPAEQSAPVDEPTLDDVPTPVADSTAPRLLDPTRPWTRSAAAERERSFTAPANAASVLRPLADEIAAAEHEADPVARRGIFGRRRQQHIKPALTIDTDEPTRDEPLTAEPLTAELVTDEVTVDEPVTDEPVTDEPVPVPRRFRRRNRPAEPPVARHGVPPGQSSPATIESIIRHEPEPVDWVADLAAASPFAHREERPTESEPIQVGGDEHVAIAEPGDPVSEAHTGRLRRTVGWLFEQAPEREIVPTLLPQPEPSQPIAEPAEPEAAEPAEPEAAEPAEPEAAEPAEPEPAEPEPVAPAEPEPVAPATEQDPAADIEPPALTPPPAPPPAQTVGRTAGADLARRLAALHDPGYDPLPEAGPQASEQVPPIAADAAAEEAAADAADAAEQLPAASRAAPIGELRPTVDWAQLRRIVTPPPEQPTEQRTEQPLEDSVEPEPVEPEPVQPEPVELPAPPQRVAPRPRPYATAPTISEPFQPKTGATDDASTAQSRGSWLTRDQVGADGAESAATAAGSRADSPAEKLDKGGSDQTRRWVRTGIRISVVLAIIAAAVIALRMFVVAPYYIPSASMEPTLHGCPGCNNDHVLVDKLSYRMHPIHRGDVVVFNRPSTWGVSEKVLIKRVVGLPGDTLTVRDGHLLVNGLLLNEPYLNPACPAMTSLGEAPHKATTVIANIPPDTVFVMGDNRCDSTDSRAYGVVPDAKVIGRAFLIIWPFNRLHFL